MKEEQQSKSQHKKPILITVFVLILVGLGVFAALNYQFIADIFSSLGYQPEGGMANIKTSLDLNGTGERIFYASRPSLEAREKFNEDCNSHEAGTSVLGCYTNRTIYVYDINSDELKGVKESTTAHELLHAAWARLSDGEKNRLGEFLNKIYADEKYHELLDTDLKNYEEKDRLDELHSRIGTEIKSLPDELEKHYAEYFKDQDKIVGFYDSYVKPFNELKAEIEALSKAITDLRNSINSKSTEYENRANSLNLEISEFNSCANTLNCFSSQSAFYGRRGELVAEQEAINALYAETDALIKDYNAKVAEYNANILKNQSLENLINSNKEVNNL